MFVPATSSADRREEQKHKEISERIKDEVRDKTSMKRQAKIHDILEEFRGIISIAGMNTMKKEVLITHMRNDTSEIVASRKELRILDEDLPLHECPENEGDGSQRGNRRA